jgi:hypothetical protein
MPREESHGLGLFVRGSPVGLGREAATAAFDRDLAYLAAAFTGNQLRFIEVIVEQLRRNGVMAVSRLYESPVTQGCSSSAQLVVGTELPAVRGAALRVLGARTNGPRTGLFVADATFVLESALRLGSDDALLLSANSPELASTCRTAPAWATRDG